MKVLHFHRKPHPFHYSIEQLFEAIRQHFPKDMRVEVAVCPHPSQGLLPRLKNLLFASRCRGDIYHITGDVHYLALALPRKNTILTVHDLGFLRQSNPMVRKILYWFWLKIPLARVAMVTTISEATKQDILRYLPRYPEDKIQVIPNPVLPFFRPVPKSFDAALPTILLVGTKPNKNLPRILAALEGIPCRIRIIGERKAEAEALFRQYRLPHTWLEHLTQEELLEAYSSSDLLLFASTLEGFGMPILEAQAVGRPVITSNCSSMPEVAGEGACLVDPFDIDSIREGLLRVIGDGAYRDELVQKGWVNVKRFEAGEVARRYAELYTSLNSPRRR
ncbi:MAG: glycosyltransferase family 4 protein [Saprospirales bacterium]|nr:glycosyltransferase family 4 protein [Saprospirales bacterium]